eukprot:5398530-Prymnesium_polylepis.1
MPQCNATPDNPWFLSELRPTQIGRARACAPARRGLGVCIFYYNFSDEEISSFCQTRGPILESPQGRLRVR